MLPHWIFFFSHVATSEISAISVPTTDKTHGQTCENEIQVSNWVSTVVFLYMCIDVTKFNVIILYLYCTMFMFLIFLFLCVFSALQLESDSETVKSIHSCPLCGDSFDNRTGQSNHIRGHLKKLGKSFATKNKSPLFLLRELMRDKKEFQRALQILGKRRNHFQYGASPKLSSVDCFTPPIEIPKSNSVPSVCTDARPLIPTFSLAEMESDKRQLETKLDVKNSLSGTTALIGILKKRKCQEDARLKGSSQMSRNMFAVSSNSEHSSGSRVASSLPKSISGK